jgi:UDP-N-acetylmuramoyl-L-alanyl-D-glutamate--2,6-diaminopimelate ligase
MPRRIFSYLNCFWFTPSYPKRAVCSTVTGTEPVLRCVRSMRAPPEDRQPSEPGTPGDSAGRTADATPADATPADATPAGATPAAAPPKPLGELLDALTVEVRRGHVEDAAIAGIATRAEDVLPGTLFVALPGSSADGHAFIADAARRGAAAIIVERDVGGALATPLIRVGNARRALAELAAVWYGRPADSLALIGITGTAGKTSTLSLLEAALVAGGERVGSIGSLGLQVQGQVQEKTVYTTPDPLVLHHELARLAEAGSRVVAMEATSHALVQERIHGLRFAMGIFTNLLPLEHSEYHDGFDDYVRAKTLFFRYLVSDAPLVYNQDDPVTRVLIEARKLNGVPVGTGRRACVRIAATETSAHGTRVALEVVHPIPRLDGGTVEPRRLDLRLRLLGRSNTMNTALAATAALVVGVDADQVVDALGRFAPPRRRLQVVHQGRFTILDDTVGHPESITAFFEVVGKLRPRHSHVVFAVRGRRGERINEQNAQSVAIWAQRLAIDTLIITRSEGAADELNRVDETEYEAFLEPLRHRGIAFEEVDRLELAVHAVLERAGDGDVVALLGAQGMDTGQDIARAWLEACGEGAGRSERTDTGHAPTGGGPA